MSQFPKVPSVVPKNHFVGQDFDVVKRNSVEKFEQKLFKYNTDRLIPARNEIKSRFLKQSNKEMFDISLSENNFKTMKKVQYQNQLRKVFSEMNERNDKRDKEGEEKLIHLDWACKLVNIREKFLPDFETLEKKSFQKIHNYIWSSKQIIASSSSKKVCLYHPMNGFTRALDINDKVCITFSNSGDFLAMAYRKSRRENSVHDVYVFCIDHGALFTDERLETQKIRSTIDADITALCFTRNDEQIMCGTKEGSIYVIATQDSGKSVKRAWTLLKRLSHSHQNEVIKISFSANHRYMASVDTRGIFKIWNGGSWTLIFTYFCKEESRLYKHFEWHPYVENELIFARQFYPAIHLFNVTQRKVVASFMNWKDDWELTSIAFNPVTAQLAVCFYNDEEFINRVSILASMSQTISSFDFDYIEGGLKLFWNSSGNMLGAGAQSFRFAFWSFKKNMDFGHTLSKEKASSETRSKSVKEALTLSEKRFQCLR